MAELHRIIVDTDTGGDDAAALILAVRSPSVELLGVTVAAGNVCLDQAVKNALAALEAAGSDVRVYAGATAPVSGEERETFSVYGNDGMGDAGIVNPRGHAEEEGAIDFMLRTVAENPRQIEIVALGPATNVALAIRRDRETMKKVKRIWSMGTAGFGPGNATPIAEFNVYKDAEAYAEMLSLGVPVTVVGLDMDDEPTWVSEEEWGRMLSGRGLQPFIAKATGKLLQFKKGNGIDAVDLPDAVAMACLVWDDFVLDTAKCAASCITAPGETHGLVIFYKVGFTYDSMPKAGEANVSVVTRARKDIFVSRLNEILAEG